MKELTLVTEATIEYRSSSPEPDSWASAIATDAKNNAYRVWFKIDPDVENLEDACDWTDLSDYERI